MVKERLNMHDFVGSPLACHFEASMAREPAQRPHQLFVLLPIFAGMDVELFACVRALLLVACGHMYD